MSIKITYSTSAVNTSKPELTIKEFMTFKGLAKWIWRQCSKQKIKEKTPWFLAGTATVSRRIEDMGPHGVFVYENDESNVRLQQVQRCLVDYQVCGWTTWSNRGRKGYWRLVLAVDRPIESIEELHACERWLHDLLNERGCPVRHSPESRNYARLWFLPAHPGARKPRWFHNEDGKVIPVSKINIGIQYKVDRVITGDALTPLDRIRDALMHVPADDYFTWIKCGAALYHSYGDMGRELWEEWSATSDKWDSRRDAKRWHTFERIGKNATLGSIFYIAAQHGYGLPEPEDEVEGEIVKEVKEDRHVRLMRLIDECPSGIMKGIMKSYLAWSAREIPAYAFVAGLTLCGMTVRNTAAGCMQNDRPLFSNQMITVVAPPGSGKNTLLDFIEICMVKLNMQQHLKHSMASKERQAEAIVDDTEINGWMLMVIDETWAISQSEQYEGLRALQRELFTKGMNTYFKKETKGNPDTMGRYCPYLFMLEVSNNESYKIYMDHKQTGEGTHARMLPVIETDIKPKRLNGVSRNINLPIRLKKRAIKLQCINIVDSAWGTLEPIGNEMVNIRPRIMYLSQKMTDHATVESNKLGTQYNKRKDDDKFETYYHTHSRKYEKILRMATAMAGIEGKDHIPDHYFLYGEKVYDVLTENTVEFHHEHVKREPLEAAFLKMDKATVMLWKQVTAGELTETMLSKPSWREVFEKMRKVMPKAVYRQKLTNCYGVTPWQVDNYMTSQEKNEHIITFKSGPGVQYSKKFAKNKQNFSIKYEVDVVTFNNSWVRKLQLKYEN